MDSKNQLRQIIACVIAITGLLIIPFLFEIENIIFYIMGAVILIAAMILRIILDEKFEKRFLRRWGQARKKGFWLNVVSEGLRSLCIMTVVVCLSQFMTYGRTPLWIISQLSNQVIISMILFLIILNLIVGILLWYENEKRYEQLRSQKEC